ncbi:MAG: SCO family protein [Gammaproteobacteria bacterium]|uniref:SCO family protein n=1 Tax=Candidatus Thiopontia autotrophica TaxID=2841688 RepID=A0A8J6TS81_9GAMM|nr:SCO family protein [Candidatus Thiopontia autotrophica]MBL6969211.1 SCO family protein [Gammaproteobacteria bacterium]
MKRILLRNRAPLWLVLFGLSIVLAGCDRPAEQLRLEGAMVLSPPKVLSEFALKQRDLGEFTTENTKGEWSLFFFGYTRCPDVCPTELFMLSEMMRTIEKSPDSVIKTPKVVFVSVDPQRDTIDALQEYAGYYHPSFLGVTGEQDMVDKLSRSMGAIYERVYYLNGRQLMVDEEEGVPEGLEDSYLINHSASIFLLNPEGEMHAIFSTPHNPDVMVRDLATIQRAWD